VRGGRARPQNGDILVKQDFSVFITNIPEKLDKFGLKGIFKRAGTVRDAYIPQGKEDRFGRNYGFVRFQTRQEARRNVKMLDNTQIIPKADADSPRTELYKETDTLAITAVEFGRRREFRQRKIRMRKNY